MDTLHLCIKGLSAVTPKTVENLEVSSRARSQSVQYNWHYCRVRAGKLSYALCLQPRAAVLSTPSISSASSIGATEGEPRQCRGLGQADPRLGDDVPAAGRVDTNRYDFLASRGTWSVSDARSSTCSSCPLKRDHLYYIVLRVARLHPRRRRASRPRAESYLGACDHHRDSFYHLAVCIDDDDTRVLWCCVLSFKLLVLSC